MCVIRVELLGGGPDDVGVGVADVERPDPAGEVDEDVAVDVRDERAAGAAGVDRGGVADSPGDRRVAPRGERPGLRAGDGGLQADRSGHDESTWLASEAGAAYHAGGSRSAAPAERDAVRSCCA